MNEQEKFEFRVSLEGILLTFFSTPEWKKMVDENPDTYVDMVDEAIASISEADSYEDLPKWLYTELDKLGAFISEEESVQKSLDDWNPNE